MLAQRRNNFFS